MGKIHALPIFVVLVSVILISIPEANAAPDITLDKTSAMPGGSVKVVGFGFSPFTGFEIFYESSPTLIGTGTTDSSGGFTITVTIPLTTTPGTHGIVATDGHSAAAAPITITSPSIPEFPFPFGLVLVFVAVAAMYVIIRQKMIPNFKRY